VTRTDLDRWQADVVLSDGGTVRIRPIRPDDHDRILALYEQLSDDSLYLRFFSPVSAPTAGQLERLTEIDYDVHVAVVAELGEELVALARYDRDPDAASAEVAFTVRDDQQGRGLGMLLLEHLAAIAREHGITRFHASTLPTNRKMISVFRDAGFEVERSLAEGVIEVSFPIAPTEASIAAQDEREHHAEARSTARLLSPRSIAVIGAGRTPGTIGHEVFRNLILGGFNGPVYPVNARATAVASVRSYPSILEVPDAVDLAVITVPAADVPDVVRDCARKRVGGLVVITAGFAEVGGESAAAERDMAAFARHHGMRMVGPNCMGIVNTHPEVRMNATFAPFVPAPGRVGFSSQSGGLGIELLGRAADLGLGISTFLSIGNKADVSSNDLLQYWEDDPDTDVILLYLESFGNPVKFARLARRIGRKKPIIAVKSGRTTAGSRGASSHTAALASPDTAVDALFRQVGVIRVDSLEDLFGTAQVLAHQPLPPGRRVAIVSNGGGPGILAADACEAAGLEVPELSEKTQAALRAFVSPDAGLRNPVDLVASATAGIYEQALRVLLASDEIDSLLVIFVPPLVTEADDVADAIVAASATAGPKPVIACFLAAQGIPEALQAPAATAGGARAGGDGVGDGAGGDGGAEARRDGGAEARPGGAAGRRSIPSFAFPESAAAALGRAVEYAAWRHRPEGRVPVLGGIDVERAGVLVAERLDSHPDGVWLDPDVAATLLGCFGIPVVPTRWVAGADGAAAAAADLGLPAVLKVGSGEIVHKSDVGGVRLGLASEDEVRDAFRSVHDALGDAMGGAVVQPMLEPGVETIVGVTHDESFGPLVLFGLGGVTAELMRDTALRVMPLTDVDARELVRSLRGSPLLFGYRGRPAVDVASLEDLLLRVGAMVESVPEIAEMDANPVIVSPTGAVAVDVKVRLAPVPTSPLSGVRRMRAS